MTIGRERGNVAFKYGGQKDTLSNTVVGEKQKPARDRRGLGRRAQCRLLSGPRRTVAEERGRRAQLTASSPPSHARTISHATHQDLHRKFVTFAKSLFV